MKQFTKLTEECLEANWRRLKYETWQPLINYSVFIQGGENSWKKADSLHCFTFILWYFYLCGNSTHSTSCWTTERCRNRPYKRKNMKLSTHTAILILLSLIILCLDQSSIWLCLGKSAKKAGIYCWTLVTQLALSATLISLCQSVFVWSYSLAATALFQRPEEAGSRATAHCWWRKGMRSH